MSDAPAQQAIDPAAAEPGMGRRIKRFILLLLFFVVAGPPVGSMVLFTIAAIGSIETVADAVKALSAPLIGLLFSPFSYFFGAVPALIGGAVVAGRQAFFGPVSASAITVVGVVLGLVVVGVTQRVDDPAIRTDWPAAFAMVLTVVLPALICWYPMRKRYYSAAGSGSKPAETTT